MKGEVSPIEILKRTPKNNCGECGFDTCMSFATSVVRRKIDINVCKYINIDPEFKKIIDEHFSIKKERKPEVYALSLLEEKLLKIKFSDIYNRLGIEYKRKDKKDIIIIKYFGKDVILERTDDKINCYYQNKEELDVWDRVLIYNYLIFSGKQELEEEWIAMESMPNSVSKVKAIKSGCEEPIIKNFSGKLDELKKRIKKLPSKIIIDDSCNADICAIIYVLPKIHIRINFWDMIKEEGFDASIKFLYQKNILDYLDIESLVFATEKVVEKILKG